MSFELTTNRPLRIQHTLLSLRRPNVDFCRMQLQLRKGTVLRPIDSARRLQMEFRDVDREPAHCEHSVKAELGLKYAQLGKPSPTVLARCSEMTDSEDQLRLFIDTIHTLAWSARPDGSAQFFNQHWIDYTGIPVEQVLDWGRLKADSDAETANYAGF